MRAAPRWSPAAAALFLETLQEFKKDRSLPSVEAGVAAVLDGTGWAEFADRLHAARYLAAATLAAQVLEFHRAARAADQAPVALMLQAARITRCARRVVAGRGGSAATVPEILDAPRLPPVGGFGDWLDADGWGAGDRPIPQRVARALLLLRPALGQGEAVVCVERALNRVRVERSGGAQPEHGFVAGLLHRRRLPTAVQSESDHFFLLARGRFMRPRELARAFGVAAPSPLASALGDRAAVSPRQAVALLGQAVHVAPVEWLLRRAATRLGLLQRRVRYASVFSGVDVAAAAMDVLWPARWSYSTAAECDAVARRALLAAWGSRGLQASAVFLDAGGAAAMAAPYADVWVCTPSCKPFSRIVD